MKTTFQPYQVVSIETGRIISRHTMINNALVRHLSLRKAGTITRVIDPNQGGKELTVYDCEKWDVIPLPISLEMNRLERAKDPEWERCYQRHKRRKK